MRETEGASLRICPNPDCPHRQLTGKAAEYRAEGQTCADCGTPLISAASAVDEHEAEPVEMLRLDEALDRALVPIVVAMLEEAEIGHRVAGERLQDLFGIGRWGTGYNFVTGPVRLWVEGSREDDARRIVDAARNSEIEVGRTSDSPEDGDV